MLAVPLKVTKRYDIAPVIADWIDSKPQLPSSNYSREGLLRINALRNCLSSSLCTPDSHANASHENALRDLTQYHAALWECEMVGFPVAEGESQKFPLSTTWSCAFEKNRTPPQVTNLRYERDCALFDVGAMESYLAGEEDYNTKIGCRNAIRRFNLAAGIFSHIRKESKMVNPSVDLTPQCLEMCEKICLAQGQFCVYEMAKLQQAETSPVHSLLAKLAMGASDLCSEALNCMRDPMIQKRVDCWKKWSAVLKGGWSKYRALAEYHQSEVVEEKAKKEGKGYGMEISRLVEAVRLCDEAIRFGNNCEEDMSGIVMLRKLFSQKKEEVEKDNREIYHEIVPEKRFLEIITGHCIVKPLPLDESLTLKPSKKIFCWNNK